MALSDAKVAERWCRKGEERRQDQVRPSPLTDLLHLAVHVQIAAPLDAQQVQLLPQGRIPHQLDVKVTGDLGWQVQ